MNVNKNKKYIIISFIFLSLIISGIVLLKSSNANVVLDEVKLKGSVKPDGGMFAILVEGANGYESSDTIPSNMILNLEKSNCIDNNGQIVEDVLSYDVDMINISVGETVFCYLYFDNDKEPPTENSIIINSGDETTLSREVTLSLSSTDAIEMCISNTSTCSSWESYVTSKSHTLTSGYGIKTVYVWYRDQAGNESDYVSDTIELSATSPIGAYSCLNESVGSEPFVFTYTGECTMHDDGDGNWRVKFLSDGTFTSTVDLEIDAFLVGGGGGGGAAGGGQRAGNGGGGGGYTTTVKNISITPNNPYTITIGLGGSKGTGSWSTATDGSQGGTTSAFDFEALGGYGGKSKYWANADNSNGGSGIGGDGGSGGGGGGYYYENSAGTVTKYKPGGGGTDGSNGTSAYYAGGTGQGTTTREFGEDTGDLYAGGGAGGSPLAWQQGVIAGGEGGGGNSTNTGGLPGDENTGGGGGAGMYSYQGGDGGSGIVVIRNSRVGCVYGDSIDLEQSFTYSGHCETIDDGDGNWRIKFLSDGVFTSTVSLEVDAFLVGGGGGGGAAGGGEKNGNGGGGGGYTTTAKNISITQDNPYTIVIGEGGSRGTGSWDTATDGSQGGTTSAFDFEAIGGYGGKSKYWANADNSDGGSGTGGDGGSGGGGGGHYFEDTTGNVTKNIPGSGGTDGSNGTSAYYAGGTGQGTTTREFGEDTGDLYAGGGAGGSPLGWKYGIIYGGSGGGGNSTNNGGINGTKNTGGGGGAGLYSLQAGNGGTGIVVIRNVR